MRVGSMPEFGWSSRRPLGEVVVTADLYRLDIFELFPDLVNCVGLDRAEDENRLAKVLLSNEIPAKMSIVTRLLLVNN